MVHRYLHFKLSQMRFQQTGLDSLSLQVWTPTDLDNENIPARSTLVIMPIQSSWESVTEPRHPARMQDMLWRVHATLVGNACGML